MKGRRRLFTGLSFRLMKRWAYGGPVMSPGTVVVAKEPHQEKYGNGSLKVSYYSRVLGLNSVILLDANGKQQADITQKELNALFTIVQHSDEDDDFQIRTPIAERYWGSARGE
jgi:hypothetical protein